MLFLWEEFFDLYRSLPSGNSTTDITLSDYIVTDVLNYFLSVSLYLSACPSGYLYLYTVATLQYISTIIYYNTYTIYTNIIQYNRRSTLPFPHHNRTLAAARSVAGLQ